MEHATLPVERADHRSRELRRAAGLEADGMGGPIDDQLVSTGTHVEANRDLVAHRAAGQKDRRLVPEQSRDALLECDRGRVAPPLLSPPTLAAAITARILSVGCVWVSL